MDDSNCKINHMYLTFMCMQFMLCSTFQAGWFLVEYAQVGFILDRKLNWNADGRDTGGDTPILNNITILILLLMIGMAIGANFSYQITGYFGL